MQDLTFSRCKGMPGKALHHFSTLIALRALHAEGCNLTDFSPEKGTMELLSCLTACLTGLNLTDCESSARVANMLCSFHNLQKFVMISLDWPSIGPYLSEEAGFVLANQLRVLSDLREFDLDMLLEHGECDGEVVEAALRDSIASLPRVVS